MCHSSSDEIFDTMLIRFRDTLPKNMNFLCEFKVIALYLFMNTEYNKTLLITEKYEKRSRHSRNK